MKGRRCHINSPQFSQQPQLRALSALRLSLLHLLFVTPTLHLERIRRTELANVYLHRTFRRRPCPGQALTEDSTYNIISKFNGDLLRERNNNELTTHATHLQLSEAAGRSSGCLFRVVQECICFRTHRLHFQKHLDNLCCEREGSFLAHHLTIYETKSCWWWDKDMPASDGRSRRRVRIQPGACVSD